MDRWQKLFNGLLIITAILVVIVMVARFFLGEAPSASRDGLSMLLVIGLPLAAFWLAPGEYTIKGVLAAVTFVAVDVATVYLFALRDQLVLVERWLVIVTMLGGGGLYWLWHVQNASVD